MINLSHSLYHIQNNFKHYETGFKPSNPTIEELRTSAFTPTVFRAPTTEEYTLMYSKTYNRKAQQDHNLTDYIAFRIKKSHDGYRQKQFAIGLTDRGYVDIDGVKPDSIGHLPTLANVAAVMKSHNLYHIVFQSGSAKAGKLRLIYSRHFMLYLESSYSAESGFDLTNPNTSKNIRCTDPEFPLKDYSRSMPMAIGQILKAETTYIATLLADAGINTSGIDLTACHAHMHSAHCMRPDTEYESPIYDVDGGSL